MRRLGSAVIGATAGITVTVSTYLLAALLAATLVAIPCVWVATVVTVISS